MSTHIEELEAHVADFQYVDHEHNRILLTADLQASFYFWGGYRADVRECIVDCVEAYEARYGDQLDWVMNPDRVKPVLLTSKKMPVLRDYIKSLDSDDSLEWYVSSGDQEEAGEYKIECVTQRAWREGFMSVLSFTLPRRFAFDPIERHHVFELIHRCINKLKPFHAHAGLAAVTSFDQEDLQGDEFDVATKFLGMYVEATFIDPVHAAKGIKSIDWITFISNELAERVGGVVELNKKSAALGLPPASELKEGLFFLTSEYPKLIPAGAPIPKGYLALNSLLRPLRNGAFPSMGFASIDGEPRFNRCTSDLWTRRFDAPDIWPPRSFVGLGKNPVGASPDRSVTLNTGEECTIYGRYKRVDATKSEVLLMPGDVAPYWLNLGKHGEYKGRQRVTWELVATL